MTDHTIPPQPQPQPPTPGQPPSAPMQPPYPAPQSMPQTPPMPSTPPMPGAPHAPVGAPPAPAPGPAAPAPGAPYPHQAPAAPAPGVPAPQYAPAPAPAPGPPQAAPAAPQAAPQPQPAANPYAPQAPAGNPYAPAGTVAVGQIDFSVGNAMAPSFGGERHEFPGGRFLVLLQKVEHAPSKNPQTAGSHKTVLEGVLLDSVNSGDPIGARVGQKVAIAKLTNRLNVYFEVWMGLIAALRRKGESASQVDSRLINNMVYDTRGIDGAVIDVECKVMPSKNKVDETWNLYKFHGSLSNQEIDQRAGALYAASPDKYAMLFPQGTRSQRGLEDASVYFEQINQGQV